MMMSLQLLLEAWKPIPNLDKLFHSLVSRLHKSLILVQPDRVNAQPSLGPLTPNSMSFALVIEGLPKRGCLRVSTTLDGSDFVKPGLTLIHAPRMFFHMEHGILLNLGTTNIQLISGVLGPLPCTRSLVWSALCLTNSFHISPPGESLLTNSFASKASDCVLGSMMPRPT